ncbi:MAG: hypothetical protein JKX76_02365 [Colwellia sp.]|nr:hypothetical protein [Colwellia sp.]
MPYRKISNLGPRPLTTRSSAQEIQNYNEVVQPNVPGSADLNQDPWELCISQDPDAKYTNILSDSHGQNSKNCQIFMAEDCANDWSDNCDFVYQNASATTYPNQASRSGSTLDINLTAGEKLLQNSAERAYCTFDSRCTAVQYPFDPNNPNSPMLTDYRAPDGSDYQCQKVCTVDPSKMKNDRLMDRMVQNPRACASTLTNIFETTKRQGVSLKGTKLHRMSVQYHKAK